MRTSPQGGGFQVILCYVLIKTRLDFSIMDATQFFYHFILHLIHAAAQERYCNSFLNEWCTFCGNCIMFLYHPSKKRHVEEKQKRNKRYFTSLHDDADIEREFLPFPKQRPERRHWKLRKKGWNLSTATKWRPVTHLLLGSLRPWASGGDPNPLSRITPRKRSLCYPWFHKLYYWAIIKATECAVREITNILMFTVDIMTNQNQCSRLWRDSMTLIWSKSIP